MSATTRKPGDFRGVLFGAEVTRDQFDRIAKARHNNHPKKLIGSEVTTTVDGELVKGQIWDLAPGRGYVWVALDNGQYVQRHIVHGPWGSGFNASA